MRTTLILSLAACAAGAAASPILPRSLEDGVSIFNPQTAASPTEQLITATGPMPNMPSESYSGASLIILSTPPAPSPTSSKAPSLVTFEGNPSPNIVTATGATSAAAPSATAPSAPYKILSPGGSQQWWVLGGTNQLYATSSDEDLRVGLTNKDTSVLPGGSLDLGTFKCVKTQSYCVVAITDLGAAQAGSGYSLYLTRAGAPETIVGVSDEFKIAAAGSPSSGDFTLAAAQNQNGPSGSAAMATTVAPKNGASARVPGMFLLTTALVLVLQLV